MPAPRTALVATFTTALFLPTGSGTTALAAQSGTPGTPALTTALDELVSSPPLRGARVGAIVVDLADDSVPCAHDADHGFMTASNMKLISSAVALWTLGAGHVFRTELRAHGVVREGVLHGDLEIVGSGDPTFGGRHEVDGPTAPLRRWAEALAATGLREVRGRVLGNDDCQPDEIMGEGWSWGYQGAGYAAQVSGLCFAENCVAVLLAGERAGAEASVTLVPESDYLTVDGSVTVAAADAEPPAALIVERARGRNHIQLAGSMAAAPEPKRVVLSVENPTRYAAHLLVQELRRAGIEVSGGAADRDELPPGDPAGASATLAWHDSPPLHAILTAVNKASQNLYAEQLVRAAARHEGGDGGMPSAAAHAQAVLGAHGVDTDGLVIADGSGLTRLNLVRPRQLAALLSAMWRAPERALFVSTLPIAGVDGTLARRFPASAATGRVRAKTGFISRVVALSGYVPRPDPSRPPLAFSILTNNFTCPTADAKAAVDAFVGALAEYAGWSPPSEIETQPAKR